MDPNTRKELEKLVSKLPTAPDVVMETEDNFVSAPSSFAVSDQPEVYAFIEEPSNILEVMAPPEPAPVSALQCQADCAMWKALPSKLGGDVCHNCGM